MHVSKSSIFPAVVLISVVSAASVLVSCASHEGKEDCRPAHASLASNDLELQQALVSKAFFLGSVAVDGAPPAQAVAASVDKRALVSFHADGGFSAFSGINTIAGDSLPSPAGPEGRFFVKNQRLEFCGGVSATQLDSPQEDLRIQDQTFIQVLLGSPRISFDERGMTLSLEESPAKTLFFSESR